MTQVRISYPFWKPWLDLLIRTNLYISFGAVCMTLETLVLWKQELKFQPYLALVFFATLFTYNFHRLITLFFHPEALENGKHAWVLHQKQWFYLLTFISFTGFSISVFLAATEVLRILAPFALVTIFYITPLGKFQGRWIRLRDLPFLKIFLIAVVWAGVTVLLPVVKMGISFSHSQVWWTFGSRLCFIFGITLPFDIRDQSEDTAAGMSTIANRLGERFSYRLAYASILAFLLISVWRFATDMEISLALFLSGLFTMFFLAWPKARTLPLYHYGILDGMIVLQAFLVWVCGKI